MNDTVDPRTDGAELLEHVYCSLSDNEGVRGLLALLDSHFEALIADRSRLDELDRMAFEYILERIYQARRQVEALRRDLGRAMDAYKVVPPRRPHIECT